ncbi:hypothetical protein DY000_02013275 [Brassica cretica]|uniref:Uncharacterized protein n=1 Tax=Brassica cretica TaxID=69181 RepID=A0ABQ7D296_BRACR|nr:hypothetical protein DY000_02013275 [Brassica cretica]
MLGLPIPSKGQVQTKLTELTCLSLTGELFKGLSLGFRDKEGEEHTDKVNDTKHASPESSSRDFPLGSGTRKVKSIPTKLMTPSMIREFLTPMPGGYPASVLVLSCGGRVVLFSPVTIFFAVMLLKCLFFDDGYPDPTTTPVLKNIRFVTSLIVLPIMFYVPFNYPTVDVFVSIFSFLAGGVSIYHLTSTIDIGHGLLILFLCFTNGLLAIDFAGQSFHPGAGVYTIGFFQYIVYVYNFEFLAKEGANHATCQPFPKAFSISFFFTSHLRHTSASKVFVFSVTLFALMRIPLWLVMLLKWWLREFAVSGRHVKKGGVLMWIDMLLASSCPPCEKVRLLISVAYLFIFLTSHPTLLDDVLHVSSYLQSALLQDIIGEVSLIKTTFNDTAHSSDNSTHYGKYLY